MQAKEVKVSVMVLGKNGFRNVFLPGGTNHIFTFKMADGRRMRLDTQGGYGEGKTISITSPDGRIAVMPEMSNHVKIRVEDHFPEDLLKRRKSGKKSKGVARKRRLSSSS